MLQSVRSGDECVSGACLSMSSFRAGPTYQRRGYCNLMATIHKTKPTFALFVLIGGALPCSAWAGDVSVDTGAAQAGETSEVVVTARKRVEAIQDVPMTLTSISGEELETSGISTLADLGRQ